MIPAAVPEPSLGELSELPGPFPVPFPVPFPSLPSRLTFGTSAPAARADTRTQGERRGYQEEDEARSQAL